jgi:hypothetical protein
VEFSTFHEGRRAGKSTTRGGHIIVSRKKIVTEKERSATAAGQLEEQRDYLGRGVLVLAGNVGESFFPSRP